MEEGGEEGGGVVYQQGDGVSVLFYSGTEEEEWHDGTVCRHGMRTVAHNRKPYYDVKFVW